MSGEVKKKSCPHLSELRPGASSAFNVNAGCSQCACYGENSVCLTCHRVFCGLQSKHMKQHNEQTKHPLAMSCRNLSVWCYSCINEVDDNQLHHVKYFANTQKFNLDIQRRPLDIREIELELESFRLDEPSLSDVDWEAELGSPDGPSLSDVDWEAELGSPEY